MADNSHTEAATGARLHTVPPMEQRLVNLMELDKAELADRVDHFMTVTIVLGNQLADIAELVGLDRDTEDLTITPRVRDLVADPRVRAVLDEIARAEHAHWLRSTRVPPAAPATEFIEP